MCDLQAERHAGLGRIRQSSSADGGVSAHAPAFG